jgi:hypothetical protein
MPSPDEHIVNTADRSSHLELNATASGIPQLSKLDISLYLIVIEALRAVLGGQVSPPLNGARRRTVKEDSS